MKSYFSYILFLMGSCAFAQTIVSTTPENRNVIFEEFTGINNIFCPNANAISQQIKDNNPDDVFIIRIHSGGFAVPENDQQPDYRTIWGQAIDDQSGLLGYPAGTINRQNFPGLEQGAPGSTALGRGDWSVASDFIRTQESYVNVGVEATINQLNIMNIHVEGYYTGDSPASTNKLNIAIVQNNTTGPQDGGDQGDQYNHQYRLIDMPLGQWGMDITATSSGTFIDETLEYEIPEDLNGIPIILEDLEIIAFIAETTQKIISGNGAQPTFVLGNNDLNANSTITIYPNPTSAELTISNIEGAKLEVYNILGQILLTAENNYFSKTIDVSHFSAGTFFIKISNSTSSITKQFVVIK